MRRDPRIRVKHWLWWSAFALALVALYTVFNAHLRFGSAGTLWLSQWTVRVEIGTTPTGVAGWRGHPWEVRAARRAGGTLVEVGAGLIFVTAGAIAVAAFFIRPRRLSPTLCWSCWHDLRGLPLGMRKCPECGAEQADVPV